MFLRLLKLSFSLWRWLLLAALFGLFTILSGIFLMGLSAYIIARAALMPSIADLQLAIVGVRFFGIARGIFRYLERYISHEVTFRLLSRLRVDFYTALEPLAPARLLHHRQGDLLARIVADIDTLEHFYVRVLAPPIVALLTSLCVGGLIALLFDPRLTLILFLFWGLAGIVVPLLIHYLSYPGGADSIQRRANLNIALLDGVQGTADILAYGREQTEIARVAALSTRLSHVQKRMGMITGLSTALNALLINFALVVVLLVAIPQVSTRNLTGVDLTVIVLMTIASFEAVNQLPLALQYLGRTLAAGRRLFTIMDVDLPPASAVAPPVSLTDYSVAFENVTFRYEAADPPALNHINFTLPQGERLLITGPSGAGKSTLGNLLLRFWDNYTGVIRIGDCNIQDCPPEVIRRHIAVVTQRTYLFNTTIRENLLLADREASEERLIEVAQQAQIHDFIASLPAGYDTWVGEQGLRLSGGERQRLAIARALLKDAPILLLDEPTANLDSITEQELIFALQTLMQGRTTLIITHRPLALWGARHHLALANGKIMELSC